MRPVQRVDRPGEGFAVIGRGRLGELEGGEDHGRPSVSLHARAAGRQRDAIERQRAGDQRLLRRLVQPLAEGLVAPEAGEVDLVDAVEATQLDAQLPGRQLEGQRQIQLGRVIRPPRWPAPRAAPSLAELAAHWE